MKLLCRCILLGTATLLCSQVQAEGILTPHRAEYKVRISIVSGQLNTELRATAGGYVAHHVIRPTGLSRLLTRGTMDVTSEFSSSQDGVKPVAYRSVDTIRKDPDVDIFFNWDTNEVAGIVGDEAFLQHLDGIVYDSVSIQYVLMHDLINGGPNKQYTLFDIDKLKIVSVRSIGKKQVKVKAGSYEAVGIQHQAEGSSRITTLWCVEELGYLPVVIEQHRKGKLKFRASLQKYTPTGG